MNILFIILLINVVYVSFFTMRTILTLKGHKFLAASLSSMEVFVYLMGLNLVLDDLDKVENVLAYCAGFAIGIFMGMKIEEWLALGYITVEVITKKTNEAIPEWLRDKGFGVTSWVANGRDGDCLTMHILTKRKAQKRLYNHVLAFDPRAFIIAYEPKHFHGGFWVRNLKRYGKTKEQPMATETILPGVDQEAIQELKESYEDAVSFENKS